VQTNSTVQEDIDSSDGRLLLRDDD